MSFFAFFGIINSGALDVGQEAPEITAVNEFGQTMKLGEISRRGLTLVYFYPKADTPGCTAQACSLRDSFESLQSRGVQILGVSEDSVESQKKFREKYRLPFHLLADSDGKVAKAFGVPTFLGLAKRQSFLFKDGKLVWRNLSVSPKTHISEVTQALEALR